MAAGKITQIFGQVVDVEFPPNEIPPIYTALTVDKGTGGAGEQYSTVILEVMQHMGGNTARAIVLGPPEGLARGLTVDQYRQTDLGAGRQGMPRAAHGLCRTAYRLQRRHQLRNHAAHPPRSAGIPRPGDAAAGVRNRNQGHRPPRTVQEGRQGRPLRRRRRGQDRCHHGAHP